METGQFDNRIMGALSAKSADLRNSAPPTTAPLPECSVQHHLGEIHQMISYINGELRTAAYRINGSAGAESPSMELGCNARAVCVAIKGEMEQAFRLVTAIKEAL